MHNGQITAVCVSALPRPPSPAVFLAGLEAAAAPREGPAPNAALFGDTFAEEDSPKGGQAKNKIVAHAAVRDFQKVCDSRQAVFHVSF